MVIGPDAAGFRFVHLGIFTIASANKASADRLLISPKVLLRLVPVTLYKCKSKLSRKTLALSGDEHYEAQVGCCFVALLVWFVGPSLRYRCAVSRL